MISHLNSAPLTQYCMLMKADAVNDNHRRGAIPLYKFIRDHGGIHNWDFENHGKTCTCAYNMNII